MNSIKNIWALLLALGVSSWVQAAKLGDPAGPLKVGEWMKGKPVDLKEGAGKHVYVVEFWATWCGPCRATIPHLTELQKRFGDKVTIIGVSDEDAETVKPFLAKMGDTMDYTVAVDPDRVVFNAYMKAYDQRGIPTAFVVNQKGQVAWVGHPMNGLDEVLEAVLAGKHDVEAAQAAYEEQAVQAQRQQELSKFFGEYVGALVEGTKADADKAGMRLVEALGKDSKLMNLVAWTLMTSEALPKRDLDFALSLAQKAMELTDGKSADIVDTYARGLFTLGKVDEAIRYQKKAIELAVNAEMKADLMETLAEYEAKK